ncbi:type II toxin-antitoxin system mRNA interferase toxin, RelE/StbE family [Limnohabitans planktonicus]|uniref:Addiction module toxin RelE n=1 Tax=Limnohabitans planktonicus II-D5 TaxID=1293045 RepID=A0A2T7UJ23_9BURK|nr:type II toxin-antitoxin system mRNA interferase toxin, RelE/StbE family [Limnohabitans planktonicus]PVE44675.1 addiction module toxin RelE [Limnohabitans planktonicus II-D5]
MDLLWTPESIQDRESIYDYIEADNPFAALVMDELFSQQACLLLDQSGLGRLGRVRGTREWVVHPNYILVYDLVNDQVRVLRVLHVAKRWPPSV